MKFIPVVLGVTAMSGLLASEAAIASENSDSKDAVLKKDAAKKLTLEEFKTEMQARQVESVIDLSRNQLNKKNLWVINGKDGRGPMPFEYYKNTVKDLLADSEQVVTLEKRFLPGDVIIHQVDNGSEEYLHLREDIVISRVLISVR